jgi:hypothetical protein
MRVGGFQWTFNTPVDRSQFRTVALAASVRPCADRISPDQGCLEIAVMLEESPRFWRMAAAARRNAWAIVFFDRGVALIRVFAIGAYKPV